jgi:hypothetical protein
VAQSFFPLYEMAVVCVLKKQQQPKEFFFSLRIYLFLMEFPVWSNIYQCHVKNLAPFILPLKLKKKNYHRQQQQRSW